MRYQWRTLEHSVWQWQLQTHMRRIMGAATIVFVHFQFCASVRGPLLPCYISHLNTSDHRQISPQLFYTRAWVWFVLKSIPSLVVGRLIFVAIVNIWTIVDAELSNCSAPPYAITRCRYEVSSFLSLLHFFYSMKKTQRDVMRNERTLIRDSACVHNGAMNNARL